jgi:hypothetical protein
LDKFPEAFRRFESVVNTADIDDFHQLKLEFTFWAGEKWKNSRAQNDALKLEARRLGIPVPIEREEIFFKGARRRGRREGRSMAEVEAKTWQFEWIEVRGRPQMRYRDLKTGRFIKKPD